MWKSSTILPGMSSHIDISKRRHLVSSFIDGHGGNEAVAEICSTPNKRVSPETVRYWRSQGFIPSMRYGPLNKENLKRFGVAAPLEYFGSSIEAAWEPVPASTLIVGADHEKIKGLAK